MTVVSSHLGSNSTSLSALLKLDCVGPVWKQVDHGGTFHRSPAREDGGPDQDGSSGGGKDALEVLGK